MYSEGGEWADQEQLPEPVPDDDPALEQLLDRLSDFVDLGGTVEVVGSESGL